MRDQHSSYFTGFILRMNSGAGWRNRTSYRWNTILIKVLAIFLLAMPVRAEILLNEYLSGNVDGLVDEDGDYEDWIELLNNGAASVNLAGLYLSDDITEPYQWPLPSYDLEPGAYLIVFASGKDRHGDELHCNFKLKSEGGEDLLLSNTAGQPVDDVVTVILPYDVSHGREPGGGAVWLYYDPPSPGGENPEDGGSGIPDPPFVSPDGGFHAGTVSITLFHLDPDAEVRYTLDGSEPISISALYQAPFPLDTTAVVRARAFVPGEIPGRIATRGFMVGESTSLPVIFLSTDPPNLWNWETGIYVMGPDADPDFPYFGANFWQDWEKPVHLDFYEADGASAFRFEGGMRIHGGHSRGFPQKSLRFYARGRYGYDELDHRLFPHRETEHFQTFILRNCGQDFQWAAMRDPLTHLLASELDVEWADSRPVRVYLNGVYWGFLYCRERMDKYYFESVAGADPDEIDYLENGASIIEGDCDHYLAMRDFIELNDLSDDQYYDQVPQWLEIVNHAIYMALETWYGNWDWPANNRRFWRPRTPDGAWRWVLHDLDHTLAAIQPWDHPTLLLLLDPEGEHPYEPYGTMIFRELLESEHYRNTFLNCLTELMSATLAPARVGGFVDHFVGLLEDEVDRHRERWSLGYSGPWEDHVAAIRDFANHRSGHIRIDAMTAFGMTDTLHLALDVDPPETGSIRLTTITINSNWSGTYFLGVPVPLEAVPLPGWAFDGWSGVTLPNQAAVILTPTGETSVTAHFVPSAGVVINEINYHSSDEFDPGDWVELHCLGPAPVDLGGYVFKDQDDGHEFTIPQGTVLEAGEFLVLCQDLDDFVQHFPAVTVAIGDLDFGLSNGGELLRLFDPWGQLLDHVQYDDVPPWPVEPDGGGPTLELIYAEEDNTDPANWAASEGYGTPGAVNSHSHGTLAPSPERPAVTSLLGTWPNPFNPTVTIRVALARRGPLRLTIHDIQGREVAQLAYGDHDSGWHDFTWRPDRLASGVYLARLESGGRTDTHKLILLR